MRILALCCMIAVLFVSCSHQDEADRFMSRAVTMPNGKTVYAEMAIEQGELLRGLMFRDSLAPDRGMLFLHNKMGRYSYWMFQVKIPLDRLDGQLEDGGGSAGECSALSIRQIVGLSAARRHTAIPVCAGTGRRHGREVRRNGGVQVRLLSRYESATNPRLV
jgi:hypothetical protein